MAPVNMVPSLVQPQTQWWFPRAEHDRDGYTALHMRGKIGLREALKQCQISMEEVGIEVEAQLEAFKNLTGATPVYLNGHQHVHVLPGIAAVVARVAAREGVQFMRIPDELPQHFQEHVDASRCSLYKSVSSQAADARFVFRDESLQTSDSFIGLGLMGADCSPDRLFLRLQALLQDAATACLLALTRRRRPSPPPCWPVPPRPPARPARRLPDAHPPAPALCPPLMLARAQPMPRPPPSTRTWRC